MTDAMASMLDELMGKGRNVIAKDQADVQRRFNDPEVCKNALVGLCPHTLFNNTKSDLGECGMTVHEDHIEFPKLKKEYDALDDGERSRLGYERDLYDLLAQLVSDMDRRIARAKERVEIENKPRPVKPVDQARLDALKQQEKEMLERSEQLAMEGDADGSLAMAEAAEKFKVQHDTMKEQLVTPERTKSVCEVCGVFVNSTDTEQRRLEHIQGKQFVGWSKIRDKLKELAPKFQHGRRDDEHTRRHRSGSVPMEERPRERERERDYGDRRDGYEGGRQQGDRYGDRRHSHNERERGRERGGPDRYGDRRGGGYEDRGGDGGYGGRGRYGGGGGDRRGGGGGGGGYGDERAGRGYGDTHYRR